MNRAPDVPAGEEPARRAAGHDMPARRGHGLRTHLLVLVLVALAPALVVGAAAAWYAAAGYRAASEARLRDTARALALAVDEEIARAEAAAIALAASPDLDPGGDLRRFDERARLVAESIGAAVFVAGPGPDHPRVVDTRLPAGAAPMPDPPDAGAAAAAVARVFATGRTVVGDLAAGPAGGAMRASVVVPATRDGAGTVWAVGVTLAPARLSALLAAQGLTDGAFAAVADARGIVVARSRDAERFIGRSAETWYAAAMADGGGAGHVTRGRSLEHEEVLMATHRLWAAPGWAVIVAAPYAAHAASWRAPLRGLAVGGAAALALAAALATWLARRLLRPVEALALGARAVAMADGTGPDLAIAAPRSTVAEFEALRLGIADAEAALRRRAEAERRAAAALRESDRRMQELRSEFLRVARLSEMGQMAVTLAHELSQPLAASVNYINGARRLVERAAAEGDPQRDAALEALGRAAGEAVRAGQIIRRMRGLALRGEAEKRIEDPASLVEEANELAWILAKHAQVEVRLALDRLAPTVLADRIQIQQVLLNLMHNAIEAMEGQEAERRLTVSTRRAAAAGAEQVEISVADTGPGLPEEVQAELFAPFVTTKPGGVGVGLSVCRTIVEAHGGRIWAEPNPGGGTVFRFTLPASGAAGGDDAESGGGAAESGIRAAPEDGPRGPNA
ncbi:hypothetical protein GCM10010964_35790 [Caldovatus sediminis]|uniref:histidine kinase n=2 Tax=Caldovatus sediminis TaxID=2041189 RepID=A0A8J2ZE93_9PROT|nr:hypothetical protein GCM10010964_35790 [Caldovatus sediminis]